MANYYDLRKPAAPSAEGAPTPSQVPSILAADEEPSTFESLFRFLGRPAFVLRGLITGDFEGVARNLLQFGQEFSNPLGVVNQSLNYSNLAGVKDLTRKQDRPEFSDVLHRWGAIDDLSTLSPSEKFGIDLAGGLITDPLSLVGGGGEVRGLKSAEEIATGTVGEAAARFHSAIVRGGGPKLQEMLGLAEAERLSTWARNRVVPTAEALRPVQTRLPGLGAEQRVAADALHARVAGVRPPETDPLRALEEFKVAVAQDPRITPNRAAIIEAALRGRAANDVFVKVAREEGINLSKGRGFSPQIGDAERFLGSPNAIEEELQSAFGPNAQRRFAMIASGEGVTIPDTELGREVTREIARKNLIRTPIQGLGRPFDLIYSAKNHMVGDRLVKELANLARPNEAQVQFAAEAAQAGDAVLPRAKGALTRTLNVLRDLGYDDQWSVPFLRRTFGSSLGEPEALLNSTDEYIRLGNSMPLSIANQGLERLVKLGMSPGGGLTINPLWSDTLGHAAERLTGWKYRNGFVFVPWGDVAQVTAPGMIRRLATEMGWKGPMIADEALGRGATRVVRDIFSRFYFGMPGGLPEGAEGKIATAAETALRDLTAAHDGNVTRAGREVAENMVGHVPLPDGTSLPILDKVVREDLGMTQFLKEQVFQRAQAALAAGQGWDVTTTRSALRRVASFVSSPLPNVRAAAKAAQGILDKMLEHRQAMERLAVESQAAAEANRVAVEEVHHWGDLGRDMQHWVNRAQDHARAVADHQRMADSLNLMGEGPIDANQFQDWRAWGRDLAARDEILHTELSRLRQAAEEANLPGARDQWMYDLTEMNRKTRAAQAEADRTHDAYVRAFNESRSLEGAWGPQGSLTQAVQAAGRSLLIGRLTRELVDEVAERNPSAPRAAIEKAVAYSHEKMRQIAAYMRYGAKNEAELLAGNPVPRPAWEVLEDANPFYLPHQMDPRLVEALADPQLTEAQRAGIRTVFDLRRNYKTIDEFLTALNERATSLGIPVDDVSELVQKDYAALTMQRMLAFERTKLRQSAYQAMVKLGSTEGGRWDVYREYLRGVLSPVGPRGTNAIMSVLSGGRFEIPVKDYTAYAETIATLNRSMDNPDFAKGISRGAEHFIRIEWPGLNALYKPMLTSIPTNVRFRFRNLMSNPLQAMFHPDIKFAGLAPMMESVRNDGLVRWAVEKFNKWSKSDAKVWSQDMGLDSAALHAMTPEQRQAWATQTFVRASLAPSVTERIAARNALSGLEGIKHGPYTFSQVFDVMDRVLGNRDLLQSDLTEGVETVKDLYGLMNRPMHNDPNMLGKFVRSFRKFVDTGQQWAGELETQWRMLTALQFMEQGKTPLEVVSEVNRLQVDYSRNSEVEGWIRAVIPFARYMIGATGWAAEMLANPSGAGKGVVGHLVSPQFLGTATRSLGGEDTTMAPRYVKESLALPLPWLDKEGNQQFLTSLGFPQEVVIQALSLTGGRPEAVKHVALGSMQPLVKLPAEALMGRSFYFGTDFGSYRKAPFLLQHTPISTEVPGPNGTIRYEVPGLLNELSNAAPTAGIESTINRLGDSRQGIVARLINAVTGFRIQSSDQEAELQRRISDYLRGQTRSGTVGELQVFFERLKPEDVPEDVKTVLRELEAIRARRRKEKTQ